MQSSTIVKIGLATIGIFLILAIGLQVVTQGAAADALDDPVESADEACQKYLWGETDNPQGPHGNGQQQGQKADGGQQHRWSWQYMTPGENCSQIPG
ncbi:MAG: hypothetical protein ACFFGZ_11090 [Candidatus Thorarchaeota archaeon]